ncbi:MAG: LPS export ABC transporter permease LptF [Gammaproteobacteria bacterium]
MYNRRWVTVLDKMLVSDLSKTFISVLSVVVVILVSRKFIAILSKAVEGKISNETLFGILGLKTVLVAVSFLPVAIFIAVLIVLGRMYRDQEMAALSSAGVGVGRLYRGVFMLVVPLMLLSAYLALVSVPWAEAQIDYLTRKDEQSADIRGISAGHFAEYSQGDLVFYTEDIDKHKTMHQIFVQHRERSNTGIVSAAAGEIKELPGGVYLILKNGERLQGVPGKADWVSEKFDEYAIRMEESSGVKRVTRAAAETGQLWHSEAAEDIAELQQRFAVPLGVFMLSLLAVPLARVAPRSGIYGNLLLAFLIYFIYGNLQRFNQSWVIKGVISPGIGFIWIYLLLLLILAVLLVNLYGREWLSLQLKRMVSR